MTLLEECLAVLGTDAVRVPRAEFVLEKLHGTFFGQLDWKKYQNPQTVTWEVFYSRIREFGTCYIVWSDAEMPVLHCSAERIVQNLDDVLAVSFDTWLIAADFRAVAEYYHDGTMTIGEILAEEILDVDKSGI